MCCRALGVGQNGVPFLQDLKVLGDYHWWYTASLYHHHLGTWTVLRAVARKTGSTAQLDLSVSEGHLSAVARQVSHF